MQKIGERTLSLLLAALMLMGAAPLSAFAAPEKALRQQMNTQMQATDPVGKMLTETIEDETEDDTGAYGYCITDVSFSGSTANVSLFSAGSSTLIVALYDERTLAMLTQESVAVDGSEELQSVSVPFDASAVPEHFVIRAFLVGEQKQALCLEYASNLHTTAVEEIFEKTTDDFDDGQVINLDEATDNNFMILDDDVIIIAGFPDRNTVTAADVDAGVYTLSCIDAAVRALQVGDLFYLDNGDTDEIYVIKVKSISFSGDTAEIVAEDIALEDAFEFIKIDEACNAQDMEITPEDLSEDVESCTTTVEELQPVQAAVDVDVDHSFKFTHEFNFKKKEQKKQESGHQVVTGSISAFKLEFSITVAFKCYYSKGYKEASVQVKPELKFTGFKAEGTLNLLDVHFFKKPKKIFSKWGVKITVDPALKFSIEGELTLEATVSFALGGGWDSNNGKRNLNEPVKVDGDLKIEVTIFFGVDLNPELDLIHKKLFNLKLTGGDNSKGQVGVELKASYSIKDTAASDSHDCAICIDGEIYFTLKLEFVVMIGEKTKWEIKHTIPLVSTKVKICDFYWSISHGEVGFGTCPYDHSTIPFGSYPQTRVTSSSLIDKLNKKASGWTSYRYMSGAGTHWADGSAQEADYMEYCDVPYGGDKYRGVRFTTYRPFYTNYKSTTSDPISRQNYNGYTIGTTYWFKYELLQWRILDRSTGLVICDTIIDAQPFNNYVLADTDVNGHYDYWGNAGMNYYANNYAESSLRQWLNSDFYNTAFTVSQQSKILPTTLDNSAYSTSYSAYDSVSTTDKVFLLSYSDACNAGYFKDTLARRTHGTDYAKCQGLEVYGDTDSSGERTSYWQLRSAGDSSDYACSVNNIGQVGDHNGYVGTQANGVRPVLRLSNLGKSKVRRAVKSAADNAKIAVTVGIGTARFTATDGNLYMLYSVPQDAETVELDALQYVAQASCTDGIATAPFYPTDNTVTYVVGDFGEGTETRLAVDFVAPKQYTVTWNVDGRTTAQTVAFGDPIAKPADPIKEGCTFTGWSPAVPDVMPAEDVTFTAQFTKNSYTVTWNVDGRTTAQTVAFGDPIEKPADPVKEGYTFTGWSPAVPDSMPAEDVTFTAQFAKNSYTVTWNVDGRTTSQTVAFGDPIVKPTDPVKEGYTFAGWSPAVPATMPAEDMTFTAQFEKNSYTVTWNVDGRTTAQAVAFGDAITKPADPVKEGYTFTGWSPAVPDVMPAENMTFTAQFTKNEEPPVGQVRSVFAESLTLLYKQGGTLQPVVTADSGVGYTVAYSGFDSRIVSIDANGKVTALKKGTTDVTVTAADEYGNTAECTCKVTVKYAWWQILIRIFLLGFLWY